MNLGSFSGGVSLLDSPNTFGLDSPNTFGLDSPNTFGLDSPKTFGLDIPNTFCIFSAQMASDEWVDWLEWRMEAADARMRAVKGAPAVKGGGKGGKAPAETGKEKVEGYEEGQEKGKEKGQEFIEISPPL